MLDIQIRKIHLVECKEIEHNKKKWKTHGKGKEELKPLISGE